MKTRGAPLPQARATCASIDTHAAQRKLAPVDDRARDEKRLVVVGVIV
jgi:hypothetical protein